MTELNLDQLVAKALNDQFGFPLRERVIARAGTNPDDLQLKFDVQTVRNDGPLNKVRSSYQGPPSERGNRFLLIEDAPSDYQTFIYSKARRRTRRMMVRRNDPLFGTGLFLEDSLALRATDWRPSIVGQKEIQEQPALEIALEPLDHFESAYERLVATFVLAAEPALRSLDYYADGSKLKTLVMHRDTFQKVGEHSYVKERTLQGPGNLITRLTTAEFVPLSFVREDFFSHGKLEHATRIGPDGEGSI